jgi:hypothetical protein
LFISLFVFAWLIWNFWIPDWTAPWNIYGYRDFLLFYGAGKALLQHRNPYPAFPVYGAPQFIYPPTSLLLFGFYAMFNFDFAKELWFITFLSAFVVAALSCTFMIKGERRLWFGLVTLLLVLASYPFHNLMFAGQSDMLGDSLAILSLVSQRSKHNYVSAFLLSVATLLKGPPVLLLIYFVAYRRDVKYLFRFLLSTAVIVGASLVVIPVQLYGDYVLNILPRLMIAAGTFHQSAVSLLATVNVNYLSPVVSVVGVALFAFFAFYVNSKTSGKDPLRDDSMFLMNIFVYLLLGPETSPYSYVWVILPLALVVSALVTDHKVRLMYIAVISFEAFLLSSNNYISFQTLTTGQFPLAINLAGGLMMTLSLVPIFVRSGSLIREAKSI